MKIRSIAEECKALDLKIFVIKENRDKETKCEKKIFKKLKTKFLTWMLQWEVNLNDNRGQRINFCLC